MNKPAKKAVKKPAVVAKTAPKKRGRPAGSKNKKIVMTFDDKPFFVDWENLAKRLQVALAAEIKENDCVRDELKRKRTFWERLVCLATGAV
jgi:hypothetical protein